MSVSQRLITSETFSEKSLTLLFFIKTKKPSSDFRMTSQSEGIQRLLEADGEAKKLLDQARRRE